MASSTFSSSQSRHALGAVVVRRPGARDLLVDRGDVDDPRRTAVAVRAVPAQEVRSVPGRAIGSAQLPDTGPVDLEAQLPGTGAAAGTCGQVLDGEDEVHRLRR